MNKINIIIYLFYICLVYNFLFKLLINYYLNKSKNRLSKNEQ